MRILFRVEATPKLGLGHLMRCLALAEKFNESVSNTNIVFITSSIAAGEQIKRCGYKLINLPSSENMVEEIKYYEKYIKKTIFITDIPDISEDYLKTLKKKVYLVISIDDGSDTIFYSDILINPNINPKINHKYSSRTQYYSGAKYVILKKAFEKYGIKKKQIKREAKSLFMCFGGSDRNNITQKVVNIIQNMDINILIVVGIMYPYYNELVRDIKDYRNIQIKRDAHNMDELIYDADLAIISGGTLLYETCAIGTPAIVICQNQEQNRESEFFAENYSAINLGSFDNIKEDTARNTVIKLISDYDTRKQLSKNARQLIDGRGADRIVNIILKRVFREVN
jgi:UDP-2,4-diacetamido-2,4,6-trideoxy-beta-L-altropyranose hydrolase